MGERFIQRSKDALQYGLRGDWAVVACTKILAEGGLQFTIDKRLKTSDAEDMDNEKKRKKEQRLEFIRDVAKVYGSMAELLKLWKHGSPISVFVETSTTHKESSECKHVYAACYDSVVDDGYTEHKMNRRQFNSLKTLHAYHSWEMETKAVVGTVDGSDKRLAIVGGLLLPKEINKTSTVRDEMGEDGNETQTYTLICSYWKEISMDGRLVEPYTMFSQHMT
jgi:hypothetical protein